MENILRDEEIQFYQQELWSQPKDRTKHSWYLFKGCLCSEKNNHLSKYGYRFVNLKCDLHLKYHHILLKRNILKKVPHEELKILDSCSNSEVFQVLEKK